MPNYVKNKLVISPSDFDKIVAECIREREIGRKEFDFETLIPMPKELSEIPCGTKTEDGIILVYSTASNKRKASIIKAIKGNTFLQEAVKSCITEDYESLKGMSPEQAAEARKLGEHALSNLRKHKAVCWYDWAVRNWGTKWNASETHYDKTEHAISYWTAWGAAIPIAVALSKKYGCRIVLYYADEDIGYNTGMVIAENGNILLNEIFAGGSKQAYVMACDLWECDIADYIDETWETIDGNPMLVQA